MGKGSIKKVCSNTFEHEYCNISKLVIGIDEAGRGPIAGPEVVAGVVFLLVIIMKIFMILRQ